jgi:SpoVK/Ycf46/Vps4 family AAA+-type ATPase
VKGARATLRAGRRHAFSVLVAGSDQGERMRAAEALAGTLQADLLRIDLGRIDSRFIGEAEKNLRGIFAAAERAGAVLFFDEADALFGERAGVTDARDRYADLLVDRLLRDLKRHPGVVAWGMPGSGRARSSGRLKFDAVVRLRPEPDDDDRET